MYCLECGHELPDSAKFCQKCGTQQASGALGGLTSPATSVAATPVETAEIEFRDRGMSVGTSLLSTSGIGHYTRGKFVARAFGPAGEYVAGEIDFVAGGMMPIGGSQRHSTATSAEGVGSPRGLLTKRWMAFAAFGGKLVQLPLHSGHTCWSRWDNIDSCTP